MSIKILLPKQKSNAYDEKIIFLWNLNTSSYTICTREKSGKHSVLGCELNTNVEQMCVYYYCCSQSSPAVKMYWNLTTRLFKRIDSFTLTFYYHWKFSLYYVNYNLLSYLYSDSKMKSMPHILFQSIQFYFTLIFFHFSKMQRLLKPASLCTTSPLVNYVNAHHFRN